MYYCNCIKGRPPTEQTRSLRQVEANQDGTCKDCGYHSVYMKDGYKKGDVKHQAENDERESVDNTEYRIVLNGKY